MASSASPLCDVTVAGQRSRGSSVVQFVLVGGGTLVVFPVLWLLRHALGLDTAELVVGFLMFHGAHLINDPHFSVTYLLFYRDVKSRAFGDAWNVTQRVRYVCLLYTSPSP